METEDSVDTPEFVRGEQERVRGTGHEHEHGSVSVTVIVLWDQEELKGGRGIK